MSTPDPHWGTPAVRRFGFLFALVTYLADQASKFYLLFATDILTNGPFRITPFLDFTVVWNRGVSYGLMQQSSDGGRWFLIVGSVVAASWMAAILWRAPDRLTAASLGMLVGGALGNAADRVYYGAVYDFAHLHAGTWSWYVFNVADIAIVVGVAGLLYDAVAAGRWRRFFSKG